MNLVLALGQWAAATGTAVLMIAGCTLWARLVLGWVIWPTLLAAAFVISNL
jgi:cytochrome b subunit of formate dehydrogenase